MEKKEEYYRNLLHRVGEEKFNERFKNLIDAADKFIMQAGFSECVECNERIMLHILLDYYSDIDRLKDFHGIEKVRTDKIMAYTIHWILKRKPLQFTKYSEIEKDIFVNERFALFLMINECILNCVDKTLSDEAKVRFDEYLDYILYYFKYRECNAQVVELLIESFKMGMEFRKA